MVLSNAVYRSNRSIALASMEKDEETAEDAYIAARLDPMAIRSELLSF